MLCVDGTVPKTIDSTDTVELKNLIMWKPVAVLQDETFIVVQNESKNTISLNAHDGTTILYVR